MPGRMREGSAAKAEAPQKIDDDRLSYVGRGATAEARARPPHHTDPDRHPLVRSATPRWRGHPLMHALLRRLILPMGEVERSTIASFRSASLS
jgi:hypothetical protein